MSLSATYIQPAEAKELNPNLASITDDEVLVRYIYISEEIIDQFLALPPKLGDNTGAARTFPLEGETTIPDNVKIACALIVEEVKRRDDIGDPTLGGLISSESGLDRNIKYNIPSKSEGLDPSVIPHTAKVLLLRYKPNNGGNSSISGFRLL